MARVRDEEYTYLSDREIAGTALGTSPAGVAAFSDLQRAVYQDQPQDTADAQFAAEAAGTVAQGAQSSANAAQASADSAGARADAAQADADTAQARADDAYGLASGKVTKTIIAPPPAYSSTAAAMYTQADEQALRDQVAALTAKVGAIVAALNQ